MNDGLNWRIGAPCHSVSAELMWPERYDGPAIQAARQVCAKCPNRRRYQCLNDADSSGDFASIRAGLTGEQRARITEAGADYPMLSIFHDGLVDPASLGDLLTLGLERPTRECTRCKIMFSPRSKTQRRCSPCSQVSQARIRRRETAKVEKLSLTLREQGEAIAAWKAEGLSDSSCAARLGLSASTVRRIRLVHGIPNRRIAMTTALTLRRGSSNAQDHDMATCQA